MVVVMVIIMAIIGDLENNLPHHFYKLGKAQDSKGGMEGCRDFGNLRHRLS